MVSTQWSVTELKLSRESVNILGGSGYGPLLGYGVGAWGASATAQGGMPRLHQNHECTCTISYRGVQRCIALTPSDAAVGLCTRFLWSTPQFKAVQPLESSCCYVSLFRSSPDPFTPTLFLSCTCIAFWMVRTYIAYTATDADDAQGRCMVDAGGYSLFQGAMSSFWGRGIPCRKT